MWYWIVMTLLGAGSLGMVSWTFMSVKRNKAHEMAERRGARKRYPEEEPEDDYDEDDYEYERPVRRNVRRQRPEEERTRRPRKRRQWKVIVEDIDNWESYTFVFYDSVGMGRAPEGRMYEKYLSIPDDRKISKKHCAIIHHGDKLYLRDEGSSNGTYLNGDMIDRPVVIQKDDLIGLGNTRLEIQRILRESE